MARTRTLSNMRDDAYKRADTEGTSEPDGRHPTADVTRYINQGGAELWDMLIEARGADYFRADPAETIPLLAETTSYALPDDFYLLIGVRYDGVGGQPLVPFTGTEEASLRDTNAAEEFPSHYQLRRSTATTGQNSICVLPEHSPGRNLIVDYVPSYVDLEEDDDKFDGINGWEAYAVLYAAREMLVKDDELAQAAKCEQEMAALALRIKKLAPKRDMARARRVTDVRGPRAFARFSRWRA